MKTKKNTILEFRKNPIVELNEKEQLKINGGSTGSGIGNWHPTVFKTQ